MAVEVLRVPLEAIEGFYKTNERESLRAFYEFPVIWHEARYGFAVKHDGDVIAAGTLNVAASLGEIERVVVAQPHRRRGLGRAIVAEMADVAKYYNCHKMTVMVPHERGTQKFFEACGYGVEAVLPQHTFKLDMAMMRKYLL